MKDMNARQRAKEAGEKYYETGIPCRNGHTAPRAVLSGTCTECTKKAAKAWAKRNLDKCAEYTRNYRDKNVELVRERDKIAQAKRRQGNPEVHKQLRKEHYAKKVAAQGGTVRPQGRLYEEEVKALVDAAHNGSVVYAGGYTNKHSKALFYCSKHAVEYEATPHNVVRGANPCPQCNHMRSDQEQEVADFLAQYTTVEQRNRTLLAPKEIDIWLPEYNIGIEYHGLYWHTTNKVGKSHRQKWHLAQQVGIRLVQIFEDEWLNKQGIVRNRLLAFLGKAEKRDARKLQLKSVQWSEAKKFLNSTHIQGAGPVGTCYGLYEDENLVAVATFGKSRSGAMTGAREEGKYEVLRYASMGTVRGGFTRLFAQFKRDFAPEIVVSYCDLRYGTGGLYQTAGFALDSITEPDYWWVPKGRIERITRYAVQKHKIAKLDHELAEFYAPGKTENQICGEAGWEKIHGVGNQKWVWEA